MGIKIPWYYKLGNFLLELRDRHPYKFVSLISKCNSYQFKKALKRHDINPSDIQKEYESDKMTDLLSNITCGDFSSKDVGDMLISWLESYNRAVDIYNSRDRQIVDPSSPFEVLLAAIHNEHWTIAEFALKAIRDNSFGQLSESYKEMWIKREEKLD